MNVRIAFVLFFGLVLAEEEQKAPGKIKWNLKFKLFIQPWWLGGRASAS